MAIQSTHLADLTADERAELSADPKLAALFEAGLVPFLPKPTGVSRGGAEARYIPVGAVFENAKRTLRFERRAQQVAA